MSWQRKVTAVESSTFYGIVTNRLVAHVLTPVPSLRLRPMWILYYLSLGVGVGTRPHIH